MYFFNCSKVRSDNVVGIIGDNNISEASKMASDNKEILGGQSRMIKSYSLVRGFSSFFSRWVGF
jgi:hypothetical protein